MTCQLYRHFDKDGVLLYVGISLSAISRLASHNQTSIWASEISRVEIENFPDRASALIAELVAIRAENPRHNIMGVVPFDPAIERRAALIDELRAEFPDYQPIQRALADYESLAIEANRKPKAASSRALYMRDHRRKEREMIREAREHRNAQS